MFQAQCWRESLELMPRCPDDLSLAAVCGYGEVWKKTIQNHWGPRMGSMATTASILACRLADLGIGMLVGGAYHACWLWLFAGRCLRGLDR